MSASDFDFLFGRWRVFHRRLAVRLANSTDWREFEGTSATRPVLGGAGNVEDNVINAPTGVYRAAAIRSFDASTGRWAIWWLDGRYPSTLGTPVIGAFEDGVGSFFSDDEVDGRRMRTRFLWTRTRSSSPRWEQALSLDAGETWETNWTMDFTRIEEMR